MANKKNVEQDDDSYSDEESLELGEAFDDYEDVEDKQISFKDSAAARRRLEQLMEEKALARLLGGDFYDWD